MLFTSHQTLINLIFKISTIFYFTDFTLTIFANPHHLNDFFVYERCFSFSPQKCTIPLRFSMFSNALFTKTSENFTSRSISFEKVQFCLIFQTLFATRRKFASGRFDSSRRNLCCYKNALRKVCA